MTRRANGEAVGIVLDDIQMVGQVPDFLVHVKRLAEQVDHMAVLPLVLEVDFHVLREGLEVTVIPHKASPSMRMGNLAGTGTCQKHP